MKNNKPIKKFSTGAIQVSVWLNKVMTNNMEKEFHTVSFERRYKDKDGSWKSTNSLNINDIPKAQVVLKKAYEFLVLKDPAEQPDVSVTEEKVQNS